jgi:hypothetical protein
MRRSYAAGLALAALLAVAALAPLAGAGKRASDRDGESWPPTRYPRPARLADAREIAAAAPGTVAFAVVDSRDPARGYEQGLQFSSASISKALLLAAELRRLQRDDQPLDGGTRSTLDSMIRFSDNDAASSIYARVGDAGLLEVAERAGMDGFEVTPGYWGGAQVTAGGLARFFWDLDENLPARSRRFGRQLLENVTSTQRWGIPEGANGAWRVYFKGGWRPPATEETSGPVTHQAALLEHRSGERIGLAILSDQSPGSTSYATLEGITRSLLAQPPRSRRWPAN